MSACCVSGCKNRHSSTSKLKFYRIPSGYRPFQANRKRLWLQAIQQANGSTEELKGNARVCGAHFISGEASMDHDNPDFVPSVFPCNKQNPGLKKKAKWIYGRRKRRRHKSKVQDEGETTPPVAGSPVDDQPSVFMEEMETPSSSSVAKKGETLTNGAEAEAVTETETIEAQGTSRRQNASVLFKVPETIKKIGKMIPTLCLKSVFAPAGGYKCELCNQNFVSAPELIKHQQLHGSPWTSQNSGKILMSQAEFSEHRPEPSFPCNICDRAFATIHSLKRHKLLHVRDGRRCPKCGMLFCQLHNHVLFVPQPESEQETNTDEPQLEAPESEQVSFTDDSVLEVKASTAEAPPEKPELNVLSDSADSAQCVMSITPTRTAATLATMLSSPNPEPTCQIENPLPPASHRRILRTMPVPFLLRTSRFVLHSHFRDDYPPDFFQPHLPQYPDLPPSLKVFSPQRLTSSMLEVKRNTDYILGKQNKPKNVENVLNIVKEEPCEMPLFPPDEQTATSKNEIIAYDLEIVL